MHDLQRYLNPHAEHLGHQRSVAGKVIKSTENGPVDDVRKQSKQRSSAAVV
jgi:hypothetical protein